MRTRLNAPAVLNGAAPLKGPRAAANYGVPRRVAALVCIFHTRAGIGRTYRDWNAATLGRPIGTPFAMRADAWETLNVLMQRYANGQIIFHTQLMET